MGIHIVAKPIRKTPLDFPFYLKKKTIIVGVGQASGRGYSLYFYHVFFRDCLLKKLVLLHRCRKIYFSRFRDTVVV